MASEAPDAGESDNAYDVTDVQVVLEIEGEHGGHEEYVLGEADPDEITSTLRRYDAVGDVSYDVRFEGMTVDVDGFEHHLDGFEEAIPRDIYEEAINWAQAMQGERDAFRDKYEATQNDLEEAKDRIEELEEELEEETEEAADRPYQDSPHYVPKERISELSFDRIGGLDEELDELTSALGEESQFVANMQQMEGADESTNGILLSGPPGTGKTMACKAAANEFDYEFFLIKGPEIFNKYYGKSEETLRNLFSDAREASEYEDGALIVMDEIDALAAKRDGSSGNDMPQRVVTQLLTLMDGFDDHSDVYVIGTTNRPELLDRGFTRPGRFNAQIVFEQPTTYEETKEIAAVYFPEEQAETVADTVMSDPAYVEENSGDMISTVRRQAVKLFGERNAERDGALVDTVVDDEIERYLADADDTLFPYKDEFLEKQDEHDIDELTAALRDRVADELFTAQQHLSVLPESIIADAVDEVYRDADRDDLPPEADWTYH